MLTGKQEPEVRSSTIAFLRRRREGGSERALAATALAATALADAESYPIWESLPSVQDASETTGCSVGVVATRRRPGGAIRGPHQQGHWPV